MYNMTNKKKKSFNWILLIYTIPLILLLIWAGTITKKVLQLEKQMRVCFEMLQTQIDMNHTQDRINETLMWCLEDAGTNPTTDFECEAADEANNIAKENGLKLPYPEIEKEKIKYLQRKKQ